MLEKNGVRKKILQYIEAVSERYDVKGVLIFGSHAKKTAHPSSDIDLAIISPDFTDRKHLDILRFLWIVAARIDSRIEPLPFSPSEFKNADPRTLIGEIRKNGKVIYGHL